MTHAKNPPAAGKKPTYIVRVDKTRETIESVAIAFILAFLFRTFEAEAFVIPTGSMAPTLFGRHKDVDCEECGYRYRTSASGEIDRHTDKVTAAVVETICPMCRHVMQIDPEQTPSYNGDRIMVSKLAYQFSRPQRWDVPVFKFPGDAKENYIKRMVGLPGETVRLERGDVFTRRGETPFQIARKPPRKMRAMLQKVYDNDYRHTELIDRGWPARWQPCPAALPDLLAKNWPQDRTAWPNNAPGGGDGWTTSDKFRSFQTNGKDPGLVWLRYQNTPPSLWDKLSDVEPASAKPRLVADFYEYDTATIATLLQDPRGRLVPSQKQS
jgi:signal peptidase I